MTFRHPLDYVGSDGGGGVGGGPGISVGAALALKGSGRLPIAICGDGDFLMGVTAVWTAVHYKIPLLFVLANNRSFYNDELHQERMARARNRPVENKWIGQRMSDPEVDLAAMGRAQGAVGFGPITKPGDLAAVLEKAIAAVDAGQVAVVDVRVEPGYTAVHDRGDDARRQLTRGTRNTKRPDRRPVLSASDRVTAGLRRRNRQSSSSQTSHAFSHRRGRHRCARRCFLRSRPANSSPSSDRPAAANRRSSTSSAGCSAAMKAGSRSTARRFPARMRSIGMVFQEELTFPWRNVVDNVAFPLEIAGIAEAGAH